MTPLKTTASATTRTKVHRPKMKGSGYLSEDKVIREVLRVYELVEQEDNDSQLEAALRHSLRSPLKKFKPGHFASLAA